MTPPTNPRLSAAYREGILAERERIRALLLAKAASYERRRRLTLMRVMLCVAKVIGEAT